MKTLERFDSTPETTFHTNGEKWVLRHGAIDLYPPAPGNDRDCCLKLSESDLLTRAASSSEAKGDERPSGGFSFGRMPSGLEALGLIPYGRASVHPTQVDDHR